MLRTSYSDVEDSYWDNHADGQAPSTVLSAAFRVIWSMLTPKRDRAGNSTGWGPLTILTVVKGLIT